MRIVLMLLIVASVGASQTRVRFNPHYDYAIQVKNPNGVEGYVDYLGRQNAAAHWVTRPAFLVPGHIRFNEMSWIIDSGKLERLGEIDTSYLVMFIAPPHDLSGSVMAPLVDGVCGNGVMFLISKSLWETFVAESIKADKAEQAEIAARERLRVEKARKDSLDKIAVLRVLRPSRFEAKVHK